MLTIKTVFVALATPNLIVMTAFYRQLLGQEPANQIPQVYAEFLLDGMRLGLFVPSRENPEFQQPMPGRLSLCLEVADLEVAIAAVQQAYAAIDPAGSQTRPLGDIKTASHGREIYAYDPDGNRIILHEGT
ncbi:MAG: hypothetical protein KME20_16450 [Kaiparowitsia implicata GSE-PSE-MK54-09C]|jgi:catechol 2,3-dioxygenase-like lactoylglutathione lyase family enzyme|nr:hypothetical protein [Kaiparowitsia implicata GSE-PSE-MK54-09C]